MMDEILSRLDDATTLATSVIGSVALTLFILRFLMQQAQKLFTLRGKRRKEVRVCEWWSDDGTPVKVLYVVYFRGKEIVGYIQEPFSPFGRNHWGLFLGWLEIAVAFCRPVVRLDSITLYEFDPRMETNGQDQ